MKSLWGSHLAELDKEIMDFSSSFYLDKRMYKEDIECSIAHVKMLGKQKIIDPKISETIVKELLNILFDIESGALSCECSLVEDVHTFVEKTLTKRIGKAGKCVHTARSRNDQVATDLKVYIRREIKKLAKFTCNLINTISIVAEKNIDVIMPSYTHLQRAQPSSFSHHMLAYTFMFKRDLIRLKNCFFNTDGCPLGACACSGTTYEIDRFFVAKELGFSGPTDNSIDSVSDRDFLIELLSVISIIMMHLSRFSEEIVIWSSWEFRFISLGEGFCTGSSIMPQKKNPDIAELIRGKTGKVYGDLVALLTVMKGLPLSYNRDIQEDKELTFRALDTVSSCLVVFEKMLKTAKVNANIMEEALKSGFVNATDCADYLVKKGLPFREAYEIVGNIVNLCIKNKNTLESLPLENYKSVSTLFEQDIYEKIDYKNCINNRTSYGGPGKESVIKQIKTINSFLKEFCI